MFVICHISFWQLSNFVGAILEVTRTISNNKLYFTWGCSILLLKKRKRALRPDSFFSFSYGYRCFIVVLFFTPPLARDSLSRSPRACLRSTEKRWKIAPVLQIQTSSMNLRVRGFLFLVFLHIKTDCKKNIFYNHINI